MNLNSQEQEYIPASFGSLWDSVPHCLLVTAKKNVLSYWIQVFSLNSMRVNNLRVMYPLKFQLNDMKRAFQTGLLALNRVTGHSTSPAIHTSIIVITYLPGPKSDVQVRASS